MALLCSTCILRLPPSGLDRPWHSLAHHEGAAHDFARLGQSLLQLRIGLLLDRLSVLQFFDQLHLEHLHLHDLLLLHLAEACLVLEFTVDITVHRLDSSLLFLLYFQLSETFLLYDDLVFHLVILVDLHLDLRPARLKLDLHRFGLLGFLPFR